jgi:hypothetical protein
MKRSGLVLCAALALAAASGAARANPTGFEIKGLRIGMSEAEFKKLNPKAKCESSRREKDWDSSIEQVRTCSMPHFTVATKEATSAMFAFFDDKLGSWNATFYDFYGRDIQEALTAKFGSPRIEPGTPGVWWKFGRTTMYFAPAGSSVLLLVQSEASTAHSLKLEEIKRRKNKADL